MQEQCVKAENGYTTNMFLFEVEWQDLIANSTTADLTKLGFSTAENISIGYKISNKLHMLGSVLLHCGIKPI